MNFGVNKMSLESTIVLSVSGVLIGIGFFFLKEIINISQRLIALEFKVDNFDPSTDELNDVKEILFELKGMVSVLAHYQTIFRPPGGRRT
jgi:hypothetical protein